MAITTLNGLISGAKPPEDVFKAHSNSLEAAGVWHSLLYTGGAPSGAAFPASGLAGSALTAYAGQIPFTNPTAGQNTYLTRFVAASSSAGTLRLCDRLWHNSGIVVTTTTAQTIGSPTWPARDRLGGTTGVGVMLAIEVGAATTNGAAITNMTASYTNTAGTAGRTATVASFPQTASASVFVPFSLQAGDLGVRSVESVTLGTSLVTGSVHLVAYRSLMTLSLPVSGQGAEVNAITGGMPQMFDNSVPFLLWMGTGTAAPTVQAQIAYAQG